MNLDHQAVRTGCNSGLCQRLAPSRQCRRRGTGIHHHRQMASCCLSTGTAEISSVLRVYGLEGADAALAEDDVLVAARHDVLGAHQKLLDACWRSPRLSRMGLRIWPSSLSSSKFCILRAPTWNARPHPRTDRYAPDWHDLGNDGQTGCFVRALCSSSRPSAFRPWKEYGEERGFHAPPRRTVAPSALNVLSNVDDLLLALDRARAVPSRPASCRRQQRPVRSQRQSCPDGTCGLPA